METTSVLLCERVCMQAIVSTPVLFWFVDGGGTRPYDAVLERKRQAIRRALKMQYVKTIYDPRNYERSGATRIFDANMARYHAL